MKRFKTNQGFTLVEMIVVISIIGILAAVIIPTVGGFIDRARLSNDRQNAARMTQVIQVYDIENDGAVALDAPDVRTLLDTFSDEPFNFTPQAANAGFFFIESTRTVVVRKYNDALNGIVLDTTPHRGLLLERTMRVSANNIDLSATNHPEELFGQGSHLLTTEGSLVAAAVQVIRNYADIPLNWSTLKEQTWGSSNVALFLLGNALESHLDALMVEYHPNQTLYVNNSIWRTKADGTRTIERIVFSPTTSHVPTFDASALELSHAVITLPRRVRSIGAQAFSGLTHISGSMSIVLPQNLTVTVHPNALISSQNIAAGAKTTLFDESRLIDYSAYVNVSIDNGLLTYNLEALPIRDQVIGYDVLTRGNVFQINIYTKEGLVGFATNLKVITYYYNFPGEMGSLYPNLVFTTMTTVQNSFVVPSEPTAPTGYNFTGWSTLPEGGTLLTEQDVLSSNNVVVYAQWVLE